MYTLLNLAFPHIFVNTSAANHLLMILFQLIIAILLCQQKKAARLFKMYARARSEMNFWLGNRKGGINGISISMDKHALNYEIHRQSAEQLYKRITKLL